MYILPLPPSMISLPNAAEYDIRFTVAIICIQEGKFSFGNSAVLENIKGRLIKFDMTVGTASPNFSLLLKDKSMKTLNFKTMQL